MTLRTSFCNKTVLKKNLSRFWPFMALCAFIGFLLYPASVVSYSNESLAESVQGQTNYALPFLIFCYAPICAVCAFGYLHKPRSSNMLHALPVTRNSLFISNLLSGLLLFLLPWSGICLFTLFIVAVNGLNVGIILAVFAVGFLEFLFFYTLAVFCMFLCGKSAFGVLSYLFLNFAVILTELLALVAVEPFLFGIEITWGTLDEFSPLVYLFGHPVMRIKSSWYISYYDEFSFRWLYLLILSTVSVALLSLAWLLYRKRNMENVGEAVAYPRLRPVFRVVLAFFSALSLRLFIANICFSGGISEANASGVHLSMLIGGFIGYFGVEMILRKTPRVFQAKTFLGYGIFAVVLSLMLFAVRFDWLNIVGYVPESEHITVRYTREYYGAYNRIELTDDESIETIRALHQKIVDNCDTAEAYSSYSYPCPDYRLELVYHLENGETVRRSYLISGNSASSAQQEIFEEFSSFIHSTDPTLSYIDSLKLGESCEIYVLQLEDNAEYTLDRTHFSELCEAMENDALNANLDIEPYLREGTDTVWERPSAGYMVGCNTLHPEGSTNCHFPMIFISRNAYHSHDLLEALLEKLPTPES